LTKTILKKEVDVEDEEEEEEGKAL